GERVGHMVDGADSAGLAGIIDGRERQPEPVVEGHAVAVLQAVYPDHREALVLVGEVFLLDAGKLVLARCAPGREEVDQHGLATQAGQRELLTGESSPGEVRRGLASGERARGDRRRCGGRSARRAGWDVEAGANQQDQGGHDQYRRSTGDGDLGRARPPPPGRLLAARGGPSLDFLLLGGGSPTHNQKRWTDTTRPATL